MTARHDDRPLRGLLETDPVVATAGVSLLADALRDQAVPVDRDRSGSRRWPAPRPTSPASWPTRAARPPTRWPSSG